MDSTFTVAAILDAIWYFALFFVPFLVYRISERIQKIEANSTIIMKATLASMDDSTLPKEVLAAKYEIRGNDGNAYFHGTAQYKTFPEALAAARATV